MKYKKQGTYKNLAWMRTIAFVVGLITLYFLIMGTLGDTIWNSFIWILCIAAFGIVFVGAEDFARSLPEGWFYEKPKPVIVSNKEVGDTSKDFSWEQFTIPGQVLPTPTGSEFTTRERFFEKIQESNTVFNQGLYDLKQVNDDGIELEILRLTNLLEARIPKDLVEKVEAIFYFGLYRRQEEPDTRINLGSAILHELKRGKGSKIIERIPLSEEELSQLNRAWYPFVGYDIKTRALEVFRSESYRDLRFPETPTKDLLIKKLN